MTSIVKRFKLEASDWLRYSPWIRRQIGRWKMLTDVRRKKRCNQEIARSIVRLCAIARLNGEELTPGPVLQEIKKQVGRVKVAEIDLTEFVDGIEIPVLSKCAVLKPYVSDREPGVLFISFESEWAKILHHCPVTDFGANYTLVVAPSSSPYTFVDCVFPNAFPHPVFTLISHLEDMAVYERLSANNRVVPLFASHWVNPADFDVRPRCEREIDILMVAAFGKVKRHHVLFRALRELPTDLRVVLIGQSQEGRTAESIREEARLYGVADRITIRTSLTHAQVAAELANSKISLLFSVREGSAVVVAESLFADTPVGMFEDAYIGSRTFINSSTGRLLRRTGIAEQLMDFLSNSQTYKPRQWADANISCYQSTQILNDVLRDHQKSTGGEWTRDIAPLCWRPDPQLVRSEDAIWERAERDRIKSLYGIEIA